MTTRSTKDPYEPCAGHSAHLPPEIFDMGQELCEGPFEQHSRVFLVEPEAGVPQAHELAEEHAHKASLFSGDATLNLAGVGTDGAMAVS